MTLDEIRKQYPEYDDLSDMQLAKALHKTHYSDMPLGTFMRKAGFFDEKPVDPTEGMSGLEKFGAGYGKATVDLGRGIGQMLGLVSRQDVADSRKLDEPLMKTGAGKTGYVSGMIADLLPTAAIPGANTLGGAAAIGAGTGFLMPSASTGETVANTGIGAAAGPLSILAGRGLGALYRGAKSLAEPFYQGGQEAIAGRALNTMAGGGASADNATQTIADALIDNRLGVRPFLPGVKPTTAELANNAGLSQLQRTLTNNPEFSTSFAERAADNKSAIMSALDSIAGDSSKVAAAKTARQSATQALYDAAGNVIVKPDSELVTLLQRPSMKAAFDRAANLAAEAGDSIPQSLDQGISGKALHYLKMAMDDIADNPAVSGIGKNEARAVGNTRNALVGWMGKNIPEYDAARTTYAAMSEPINQMEVGQVLRDKLQPALADYGAGSRTRAAQFAEALRNGDQTAATALGRSNARIENVMSPPQMTTLNQVAEQLGRTANAAELGRATGSNTAQNLISQNFVRQTLGPLGLPNKALDRAAGSTLLQSLLKPFGIIGSIGEQRTQQLLARAALDPEFAQQLLRSGAITPQQLGAVLSAQQRLTAPLVSGSYAASQ